MTIRDLLYQFLQTGFIGDQPFRCQARCAAFQIARLRGSSLQLLQMKILITTANGMFGGATLRALRSRRVEVRAMVRDAAKLPATDPGVEIFTGDLDDHDSVAKAVEGVDRIFLVTPMDDRIAQRETRVIQAAQQAGVRQIAKIYGAVNHAGDPLDTMHLESIAALQTSGLEWTLVSPNSLMETSLLPLNEWVRATGNFFGISGKGQVGFVGLPDVAEVATTVLTGEGHHGQNYELTGPAAVNLYEVAAIFSEVLGREIGYVDLPEAEFAKMLVEQGGFTPEAAELSVLCHLRLWREGAAAKVTDTVQQLTGQPPISLASFARQHAAEFQ